MFRFELSYKGFSLERGRGYFDLQLGQYFQLFFSKGEYREGVLILLQERVAPTPPVVEAFLEEISKQEILLSALFLGRKLEIVPMRESGSVGS